MYDHVHVMQLKSYSLDFDMGRSYMILDGEKTLMKSYATSRYILCKLCWESGDLNRMEWILWLLGISNEKELVEQFQFYEQTWSCHIPTGCRVEKWNKNNRGSVIMVQCLFCEAESGNYCCSSCDRMTCGQKFGRLLQYLKNAREESFIGMFFILLLKELSRWMCTECGWIFVQMILLASVDVRHLVPADIPGDGNCLYHSVLLLMNNSVMTSSELRVHTIVELVTNEAFYSHRFAYAVGPLDIAIKGVCKKNTYSELYEVAALCTVISCNIRSLYPEIDFRVDMAIMNSVFTPIPPIIAKYEIKVLWSNARSEVDIRATNNSQWSPNHFVPLMSSNTRYQDISSSQIELTTKI
ncbi:unnamed protein product [Adineta ricciae]|uniref:OTU domain-containing protein n=1 Tax=Adineta ricciae TaxID=249248 RepID=A0A815V3M0_ADIRI|nr:unnamed protein product [Adineta ricciae]